MNKKVIFTVGYTLFQKGTMIDVDMLLQALRTFGVQYLIDVRSVPYSKQFPQCNANCMKMASANYHITYANMPEIGAKAQNDQDVFSKASDIFYEDIFPIAKSSRPEKTELQHYDEIVDFRKFRLNEYFIDGLKRIKNAYDENYTLCLMCSEGKPIDCHRYFLISKSLEQKYGEWLEVRHIVRDIKGNICTLSNHDLEKQLRETILKKDVIRKMNVTETQLFGTSVLDNYYGDNQEEKINDFCDRYWNLIHGWKKQNHINSND